MTTALYLSIADGDSEARLFLGNRPDAVDHSPTLDQIRAVLGEGVACLDESTIEGIVTAFDLPDDGEASLASPVRVWRFLRRHEGKAASLVSVATPLVPQTAAPVFIPEPTPVVVEPVEAPVAAMRPDPRPWETAAGVAAWRQTFSMRSDAGAIAPPSRFRRFAAWGAAATGALLVVVLNALTTGAPGLAHAVGAR